VFYVIEMTQYCEWTILLIPQSTEL
jgi:hypothetical protein